MSGGRAVGGGLEFKRLKTTTDMCILVATEDSGDTVNEQKGSNLANQSTGQKCTCEPLCIRGASRTHPHCELHVPVPSEVKESDGQNADADHECDAGDEKERHA